MEAGAGMAAAGAGKPKTEIAWEIQLPMSAHAQAYLPGFLIRELARRPASDLLHRAICFEAVALFADLSGFTALSEALARSGKSGAEELTEILNWHFGMLVDVVHTHGGDVVRFGGDAISAVFRCTTRNRALVAGRAVRCALAMQAAGQRRKSIRTSAGTHRLHMKVGMAHGRVVCTVVGDVGARLDYVVTGDALQRCVAAEQTAHDGATVVDDGLATLICGSGDLNLNARRGFHVVEHIGAPKHTARRLRGARPAHSADAPQTISQFLHPFVARLLDGSLGDLTNEHRRVTVVFARCEGLDDASMAEHLGDLMRIVDDVEGHLARLDVDNAGVRLLITFGAPIAHEDDEARALQVALKIKSLAQPRCVVRIGVNTGFAFCANVGNDARREYTVMGDAVNIAARLMQAAQPGQIVVGEETRRAASARFVWTKLGPIVVKGKADPVSVSALEDTATLPMALRTFNTPFIGREHELAQATVALERALRGEGQVVLISAEAGMGKSRLAAEVAQSAAGLGFEAHSGACNARSSQASYSMWHTIWRGLFGVDPGRSMAEQAEHLQARLKTIEAGLAERFSLLGPALNVLLPEADWVAALNPQQRADALKFMLLNCLRHWASARPLLLVLEDCHWIDPASQALLQFLTNNIGDVRVAVVALYRQTGDGDGDAREQFSPFVAHAATHAHTERIHLAALDAAQSAQIVDQIWQARCGGSAGRALPAELVNTIIEKAHGNPLYIESLVQLICERGLDLSDARAHALDLPDNLRALILSRVDRLRPDEQVVLKVASVLGREFDTAWLKGCLPSANLITTLPQHLETLRRLNLMQPAPADEERYAFAHDLIQETAYDSLAFATRSLLHERVGAFIEQTYSDHIAQHVDKLAFHFGHTPNAAKQRLYFRQAGDAAKATFANAAAMDYYRRLLPLLPEPEQIEVLLSLGGVAQLIGEWDEAESRFQHALALANDAGDARAKAGCWRALGELHSRRTSYGAAVVWLEQARQAFEELGDDSGLSRTLLELSYAWFEQGDQVRAQALANEHLRIATRANDAFGISGALHNLGLTHTRQDGLDTAQSYFERALETATQSGQKLRVIHIANDVARLHWQRGEYVQAVLSLQQAIRTANEIGYRLAKGVMVGNLGAIHWEVGEYDFAITCCVHAFDTASAVGDTSATLTCLGNIAAIFLEEHKDDIVEQILTRALALGRQLNQPYLLCEPLHTAANLRLRQSKPSEAIALNREAMELAAKINDQELVLKARLLDTRLRWLVGAMTTADAVTELTRLLDVSSADEHHAAIRYAIWQIDPSRSDARRGVAEIYRRLHQAKPRREYRLRYAELTGATLPAPPTLPQLPAELLDVGQIPMTEGHLLNLLRLNP